MKKYIFKDDKINGVKVTSYDYRMEDGKEVKTSGNHTCRLYPDADLTGQPTKVKEFCKKAFTTKLKADHKAIKDAEKVEADKAQAKEDAKPKPFTGEMKINLTTWIIKDGLIMRKK